MKGHWRDYIVVEELPELYQTIASAIGREAMITLCLYMPKQNLYLKKLKPEQKLSEDYEIAAEAIGLEAAIKLSEALPNELNYIKGADELFLNAKIRWIKENFNGTNHRRIAMATGLSQGFVYEILREKRWEQMRLFG